MVSSRVLFDYSRIKFVTQWIFMTFVCIFLRISVISFNY